MSVEKKPKQDPVEALVKKRYSKIPVSQTAIEGMRMSSDDRQWVLRVISLQDLAIEEYISKVVCKSLNAAYKKTADEIIKQNTRIFDMIEKQNKKIDDIAKAMDDIKCRIEDHERRIEIIEDVLKIKRA
jgi:hypothetical protein